MCALLLASRRYAVFFAVFPVCGWLQLRRRERGKTEPSATAIKTALVRSRPAVLSLSAILALSLSEIPTSCDALLSSVLENSALAWTPPVFATDFATAFTAWPGPGSCAFMTAAGTIE